MGDVVGYEKFVQRAIDVKNDADLITCLINDLKAIADDIIAFTGMREYIVCDEYISITIRDHED